MNRLVTALAVATVLAGSAAGCSSDPEPQDVTVGLSDYGFADEVIVAEGDGTLSEAGRYLLICAIPTGVDPQEYLQAAAAAEGGPPQGVEGGPPHFANGMWGELTVVE